MNDKFWEFKKCVLPQHVDHAGVMWHGTYLNWLEEARIDSLSKAGLNYIDLLSKGFEMPVYNIQIKYLIPIKIGQSIIIRSTFNINKGPRIKIYSKFFSKKQICHTVASLDLVLISKETFKAVRKRPKFIDLYFKNLDRALIKNKIE
tara:strand:+ start:803 stop:1243 length:441 start_codon:yes stop_codon:yes gene_type:complete